jgi:mannitol/fructose-specific phosphotransferase system IIA component (Ntr-type)
MLAGKDHNSHLELLSLLSAFLDNHEAFLKQVSSVKKFVDYLNNHA